MDSSGESGCFSSSTIVSDERPDRGGVTGCWPVWAFSPVQGFLPEVNKLLSACSLVSSLEKILFETDLRFSSCCFSGWARGGHSGYRRLLSVGPESAVARPVASNSEMTTEPFGQSLRYACSSPKGWWSEVLGVGSPRTCSMKLGFRLTVGSVWLHERGLPLDRP